MSIKSNDRIFFTGKTGSGKTTAAKFISQKLNRLIVFDPKVRLSDWNLDDASDKKLREFYNGESARLRLTPPIEEQEKFWLEHLEKIFNAGDCTLYIDETYLIVPPGQRAAPILSAIWTQGREKNIGAWASAQRPTWTPLFMISEAEHYFMFRLNMRDDRRRMAEFMGEQVDQIIKDKHGFFYMQAESDQPIYYKDILNIGSKEK